MNSLSESEGYRMNVYSVRKALALGEKLVLECQDGGNCNLKLYFLKPAREKFHTKSAE